LSETYQQFRDNEHLLLVIQRIAARVGRRIDESAPMLDARLSDGSRVNAVIPPLALDGPAMSIRRFGTIPFDVERLTGVGALTREMSSFLEACVRCRLNRLLSRGEVRGGEALDMLQAMNTGHDGSMTTVHANNTRDAVRRVENMVSMAGLNFPVHAIREQISSAINLMVQVGRITGGRRKIRSI